eukprot:gene2121-4144_t
MSGVYSANSNQNAFIQGGRTTSRVLQPPGGASSFSFGDSSNAPQVEAPRRNGRAQAARNDPSPLSGGTPYQAVPHTSVAVRNPPGGRSTLTLG